MTQTEDSPGGAASQEWRRFVVLRHVDDEGTHFDLMIESGQALATWKAVGPPESCRDHPWLCRRIKDHRRDYLEYEGPVSGNRGVVSRHDEGTFMIEDESPLRMHLIFRGTRLRGCCALSLMDPKNQGWSLSVLSSPGERK
jgi:hypothetical protein